LAKRPIDDYKVRCGLKRSPKSRRGGRSPAREPFADKVVAVTGAGSGIGRALSYAFAERGAVLALNDVNEEHVLETAEGVMARGRPATSRAFDVTDASEFHAFAREVVAAHGRADILVNNAGVFSRFATFADLSENEFGRCFTVNFFGVVNGCRAFLPHLRARPEAWIVNMSSSYGFAATPLQSAYIAAKFGIRGFTDALRYELRKSNVHVMCVHPGGVRTNLIANAPAATDEDRLRNAELQQSGALTTPAHAAARILRGLEKNRRRVVIGVDGHVFDVSGRLLPVSYQRLLLPLLRRFEPRMVQAIDNFGRDTPSSEGGVLPS
jgi:NAD(P)-dependent dehydrogenase (short-subunit alcohol dehydrogenase family)